MLCHTWKCVPMTISGGVNIHEVLGVICYKRCVDDYYDETWQITTAVLQIRASQWSVTANLWPLTVHIYHVMIIVAGVFSKKSFFTIILRSSGMQVFFKTGVIRNFAIFTGKHSCCSLFLIKLQVLWSATLFQPHSERDFSTGVLLWKLQNFYEHLLIEHLLWLLLSVWKSNVQLWTSANHLFLIKNKICGVVSTEKVCRSGQIMLFTHY